MVRAVVVLITLMAFTTGAVASQPGQRITCDDFVFAIPGLRAEPYVPVIDPDACRAEDAHDFLQCGRSFPSARLDAEGNAYAQLALVDRRELWRTRADGQVELVAQLAINRPSGDGGYDTALLLDFYVEPVRGAIHIRLATGPSGPGSWAYGNGLEVCRITGLVPLAEVMRRNLGLPPGIAKGGR